MASQRILVPFCKGGFWFKNLVRKENFIRWEEKKLQGNRNLGLSGAIHREGASLPTTCVNTESCNNPGNFVGGRMV